MTKIYDIKRTRTCQSATSCVRDQHATTAPSRHMWEIGSLNWARFMLQWFISFSEFTEFSENSAPFRKNSNPSCSSDVVIYWECWLSATVVCLGSECHKRSQEIKKKLNPHDPTYYHLWNVNKKSKNCFREDLIQMDGKWACVFMCQKESIPVGCVTPTFLVPGGDLHPETGLHSGEGGRVYLLGGSAYWGRGGSAY